jgi:transcription initiation factor TFIID subunit 6
VREAAAGIVRQVCAKFNDPLFNVQPRISKTLVKALLDPTKPLPTHYGGGKSI